MARLLSSSAVQRIYSLATYAAMFVILSSFLYLWLLAPVEVLGSSYHDGAGVLQYVNPKIGTYGITPNGNGGMIPSVSPPFGMTRWTPQTREVRI